MRQLLVLALEQIGPVGGDVVSQPVGEINDTFAHPSEGIHQELLRMIAHVTER